DRRIAAAFDAQVAALDLNAAVP
ncbi:MAG: hypothetical protein QOE71_879, partial [Pseudonocardiales bacterium]|nr:hypothetical protein [Pseudonocardiales bacterium]